MEYVLSYDMLVKQFKSSHGSSAAKAAKDYIIDRYGSWEEFKAKERAFKAKERTNNILNKKLDKLQFEYNKYKDKITNKQTKKMYNALYISNLNRYQDKEQARQATLQELQDKNLELNQQTVEEVLKQVAVHNPDLDLTETEQFADIVMYIEDGMSITEAFNAVKEVIDLEDIYSNNNSPTEIKFAHMLSDRDKEFVHKMQAAQPDLNWTYEKVYRMNNGDSEADAVIESIDDDVVDEDQGIDQDSEYAAVDDDTDSEYDEEVIEEDE